MYNFHLIGLSEVSKDQSLVNNIMPEIGDRLQVAVQTVVLGMLIVFSVLAILWIILEIAGRVATKNTATEKAQPAEVIEAASTTPEQTSYENDEEIVAAITAAITLMLEAENAPGTSKGFRVVSFKRTSNNAHWNH